MKVRRRRGLIVGAVGIAILLTTAEAPSLAAHSAKTIEVLAPYTGSDKATFLRVAEEFTKSTGISVEYTLCCAGPSSALDLSARIAAGDPPDVAVVFRPGELPTLVHVNDIVPLRGLGLSAIRMKQNFGSGVLRLASVGGTFYAVPIKASSKSLIWYKPNSLRRYRLKVPRTWSQLLAITSRFKARGVSPWAVGCGPGPEDSWTLTDWFENIFLRTAGPTAYERLFAGRLRFTDASVVRALTLMRQIINNKYILGGVNGALRTSWIDAIANVFGRNGRAQLYMEGGFAGQYVVGQLNTSLRPGTTINSMPWPALSRRWGNQTIGGVDFAVALENNPAAHQFLQYLASATAGTIWASAGRVTGTWSVSPNRRVPRTAYANILVGNEAHDVATAADFHFDGSDRLPDGLADVWGTALQNIIRNPAATVRILRRFQREAHQAFSSGG